MEFGNIASILSTLRQLPDPQLQQFAAMHKNDPFLLPLAIQEDTARKEMRMAAQARAMGAEQPKVNDAAVASIGQMPQGAGGPQGGPMPPQRGPQINMPPQAQRLAGLPTLPTPNMARMADGGIAGYPDDDEVGMAEGGVARYNGQTGVQLTNTDPAVQFYSAQMSKPEDALTALHRQVYAFEAERIGAEQELAGVEAELQKYGLRQRQQDPEGFARLVATRNELAKKRDLAAKRYAQESKLLVPQDEAERAVRNPRARTAEEAAIFNNLYNTPPQGPMMPVPNVQIAGAPAAAPQPGPGPGPGPGKRPTAGPAEAASAAPAPAMAQPTAAGAKETAAQFLDRKAIEDAVKVYGTDEAAAIADARTRMQGALKRDGKAYAGLEALLKKEEEGSKGEMEQAKAFALINAGLAMMAGGSPNALQNIGKGAAAGMAGYAESVQGFKKAAKERQRALADIENARRAEERDDTKLMLQFEDKADDRMANARKFGISAIMDAGVKNAEIAARIYDTQVTQAGALQREQMGNVSRERIAASQNATQLQIARIREEARTDPESKAALAHASVQRAISASPMLKALAEKSKFDPAAAAQYAAEEERLYLKLAPELLLGPGAGGGQSSTRSAADAILKKTP